MLLQQANFLLMLGQFDQAIEAYSGVIESNPDDAEAYNNRGVAYLHKGKGCMTERLRTLIKQ